MEAFARLMERAGTLYGACGLDAQRARYRRLLDAREAAFGPSGEVSVFSAPGRTEIGGNHTDHQHGKVLAGSVNLDVVAAVAPNHSRVLRVQSEGFPMDEVYLEDLESRENEFGSSRAIVRGIAAWFAKRGCPLDGLDIYTTSSVLKGSGLSSSAAFETVLARLLNDLFNHSQCSAVELAQAGQFAENAYFGKPSGLLDQMACSVGGMVAVDFTDNAAPAVDQVHFDFNAAGHALCIIDSGADHADLTGEYAAVTSELGEICGFFGKSVLREVPEEEFFSNLPALRKKAGDRAVLRAMHVYGENARVDKETAALRAGDFDAFLKEVALSGLSSWRLLQNVVPAGYSYHQEVALALALCEKNLRARGACRVHGGGFAGTIQAFVPLDLLPDFRAGMEKVLGDGSCHILTIRPVGGVRLL